jgi:hypothetical protein
VSPWHGTAPELATAAAAVVAAAAAGYAMAGWAGLSVVAVAVAAGAMVVLRGLLPQGAPDAARRAREKRQARPVTGYSQRRFMVQQAQATLDFYQAELRPVLQHLLAARLAERHDVNLYTDPAAARRLFCRSARDARLWPWIDPERPEVPLPAGSARGIPRRTLDRLIDRLEKL